MEFIGGDVPVGAGSAFGDVKVKHVQVMQNDNDS